MENNYNIVMVFAMRQHRISLRYMCVPLSLNPPTTFLPTLFFWVVTEHQLWVPCFMHETCTGHCFTYGNAHVSMVLKFIIISLSVSTFNFWYGSFHVSLCIFTYVCICVFLKNKIEIILTLDILWTFLYVMTHFPYSLKTWFLMLS